MGKSVVNFFATALTVMALTGCATTSVMGSGFEKIADDIYTLQVGTGGGPLDQALAAEEAAKSRLVKEAQQFLIKNTKYVSYKITNTQRSVFPLSYYKYTVEFK